MGLRSQDLLCLWRHLCKWKLFLLHVGLSHKWCWTVAVGGSAGMTLRCTTWRRVCRTGTERIQEDRGAELIMVWSIIHAAFHVVVQTPCSSAVSLHDCYGTFPPRKQKL